MFVNKETFDYKAHKQKDQIKKFVMIRSHL